MVHLLRNFGVHCSRAALVRKTVVGNKDRLAGNLHCHDTDIIGWLSPVVASGYFLELRAGVLRTLAARVLRTLAREF